jgi:hypothetical protein
MGPLLQEMEARRLPEWKDIADCNTTFKGFGTPLGIRRWTNQDGAGHHPPQ